MCAVAERFDALLCTEKRILNKIFDCPAPTPPTLRHVQPLKTNNSIINIFNSKMVVNHIAILDLNIIICEIYPKSTLQQNIARKVLWDLNPQPSNTFIAIHARI